MEDHIQVLKMDITVLAIQWDLLQVAIANILLNTSICVP